MGLRINRKLIDGHIEILLEEKYQENYKDFIKLFSNSVPFPTVKENFQGVELENFFKNYLEKEQKTEIKLPDNDQTGTKVIFEFRVLKKPEESLDTKYQKTIFLALVIDKKIKTKLPMKLLAFTATISHQNSSQDSLYSIIS